MTKFDHVMLGHFYLRDSSSIQFNDGFADILDGLASVCSEEGLDVHALPDSVLYDAWARSGDAYGDSDPYNIAREILELEGET